MSPDGEKISITSPTTIEGKEVTGDGWTLNLTEDYRVEKEETTGNFILVKKHKDDTNR